MWWHPTAHARVLTCFAASKWRMHILHILMSCLDGNATKSSKLYSYIAYSPFLALRLTSLAMALWTKRRLLQSHVEALAYHKEFMMAAFLSLAILCYTPFLSSLLVVFTTLNLWNDHAHAPLKPFSVRITVCRPGSKVVIKSFDKEEDDDIIHIPWFGRFQCAISTAYIYDLGILSGYKATPET